MVVLNSVDPTILRLVSSSSRDVEPSGWCIIVDVGDSVEYLVVDGPDTAPPESVARAGAEEVCGGRALPLLELPLVLFPDLCVADDGPPG